MKIIYLCCNSREINTSIHMQSINIQSLAQMIKSKTSDRGLRETAKEIGGISVSTLSRVENGNLPDMDTYMKLCKWLDVPFDFFASETLPSDSNKNVVVANLRADKTLSPDMAEALIKMIDLAYANVKD
jgi:transcriptional regulator with XRE-family HTH domain